MRYLPDVDLDGMHPSFVYVQQVIVDVYDEYGYECVFTSLHGGTHGYRSLHPHGNAADTRKWAFKNEDSGEYEVPTTQNPVKEASGHGAELEVIPEIEEIAREIRERTPSYVDVVIEDTHLHTENDHPNLKH